MKFVSIQIRNPVLIKLNNEIHPGKTYKLLKKENVTLNRCVVMKQFGNNDMMIFHKDGVNITDYSSQIKKKVLLLNCDGTISYFDQDKIDKIILGDSKVINSTKYGQLTWKFV